MRKISETEWDFKRIPAHSRCADIDGHLRKESDGWHLEVYDAAIKNADKAHQQSYVIATKHRRPYGPDWQEVLAIIEEFELRRGI